MKIEPLNNEHRMDLGIALGIAGAANLLRSMRHVYEKLPGYNTAIACLEAVEAAHRAEMAGMNFRAAVAAGVDISTHMVGLRGKGEIFAEPMDSVQTASFASGIEAPSSGETRSGSTEGESPVGDSRDAQDRGGM